MTEMLGATIKYYRLQKGLAQHEVAFEMGWAETASLSKIEKGVTKHPTRKTIDKLCSVLNLKPEEKNNLLLSGGYRPTKKEIKHIRKFTHSIISDWPYPATVYDFSWRILNENKVTKKLYYSTDKEYLMVKKDLTNVLELNFDPKYSLFEFFSKKEQDFITQITARFIIESKGRTSQKWYTDLMRKLMKNKYFVENYKKALALKPSHIKELLVDFYPAEVTPARNKGKILKFNVFCGRPEQDKRIIIEFMNPANRETFDYFNKE
jgi:transcriptional regulator with XRE-family HTH domain